MGLVERMSSDSGRAGLLRVPAHELLHGAVRAEELDHGWWRPWRLASGQVRALSSCLAWHPGLYRQMAACTAGISVEFETDAREVALEVLLDEEPRGTAEVLAFVDGDEPRRPHDGVSAMVDGVRTGLLELAPCGPDATCACVRVRGDESDADGEAHLPGMGDLRRVRFFLPALRGCRVRSVACDGTRLEPVSARRRLLVIGDSIAQGFACDDPSLAWPTLVADELGLDVLNQGIGGQVAQPSALEGLAAEVTPERIVVALGENYRYEPCRATAVGRDLRVLLDMVAHSWPDAPCWVLTPLWHDDGPWPTHARSCFAEVPSLLAAAAVRHQHMGLVDGLTLMAHDPALMADGFEHPDARGMRQVADGILAAMAGRRASEPGRRAKPRARREAREVPAGQMRMEMLPLDFGDEPVTAAGSAGDARSDGAVVSVPAAPPVPRPKRKPRKPKGEPPDQQTLF